MTSPQTAILVLVATVIAVEGPVARTREGLVEGLRPEDEGAVFYELKVGAETRRVDVGTARVTAVDELGARLEVAAGVTVRPGYRVRFELPAERAATAELLRLARERLDDERYDELTRRLLDRLVGSDPALEDELLRYLEARRAARGGPPAEPPAGAPEQTARAEASDASPATPPPAPSESAAPPPAVEPAAAEPVATIRVGRIQVAGGSHHVGLPPGRATYYSQQPRFQVELPPFWVDRSPVTRRALAGPERAAEPDEPATGLSWDQADLHCRNRGGRLPTEMEWEIAVGAGALWLAPELLEWTSSWYQPYPGNRHPEEAYGERVKVLRGAAARDDPDRFRRRYLDPASSHPRVGFRCAGRSDGSSE